MSAQPTEFPENTHDHWFCKRCKRRGFIAPDDHKPRQYVHAYRDHAQVSPECSQSMERYDNNIVILTDREVYRSAFGFDFGRDFIVEFHAAPIFPRQLELAL